MYIYIICVHSWTHMSIHVSPSMHTGHSQKLCTNFFTWKPKTENIPNNSRKYSKQLQNPYAYVCIFSAHVRVEKKRNSLFHFYLRQNEKTAQINHIKPIHNIILRPIATIISTLTTNSNKMLLITIKT